MVCVCVYACVAKRLCVRACEIVTWSSGAVPRCIWYCLSQSDGGGELCLMNHACFQYSQLA